MNFELGSVYSLVLKERAPEEFDKEMRSNPLYDKIYGFITYHDGEVLPLYITQKNYIISENGVTYSNLTY